MTRIGISIWQLLLFSAYTIQINAQKNMSTLSRENLKGRITSITEYEYEFIEKFGQTQKGALIKQSISKFDSKGNRVLFKSSKDEYGDWDDFNHLNIYQYDSSDNILEIRKNLFFENGSGLPFDVRLHEISLFKPTGKKNQILIENYSPDGKHNLTETYLLNPAGNIIDLTSSHPSGKVDKKYAVKYDASNRMTERTDYTFVYGILTHVYKVDDKNNPIEEKVFRSNGVLREHFNYTYVYDVDKNWITRTTYSDKKPIRSTERKITYFNPYNKEKKTDWSVDGLKGRVKSIFQSQYYVTQKFEKYVKGRLREHLYFFYDEEGLKLNLSQEEFRESHKYDSLGNIIESYEYSIEDPDTDTISKKMYRYDSIGNLTETIILYSSGKMGDRVNYQYDPKGDLIEEDIYHESKSENITKKIYDNNGNLIESNYYSNKKLEYAYKYINNENGNVVEERRRSYSDWGTSEEIVTYYKYEYDQFGNWIKSIRSRKEIPDEIIERKIDYYPTNRNSKEGKQTEVTTDIKMSNSFDSTLKKFKDISKHKWVIYSDLSKTVNPYYGEFKFISDDVIEFTVDCGKHGDIATLRLVKAKPTIKNINLKIENPDTYLVDASNNSYYSGAGSLKIINDKLILGEFLLTDGTYTYICGGEEKNIFKLIRLD